MKNILLTTICTLLLIAPGITSAEEETGFGDFEQSKGIFGNIQSIDTFIAQGNPLTRATGYIVTFVTAGVVVAGLISVVVGGYVYMTAGGSAEQVGKAKSLIGSGLLGIVLALTTVLILNTINPDLVPKADPEALQRSENR